MKNRLFTAGIAALLLAGCTANEWQFDHPGIPEDEAFHAAIEDAATRVFVDDDLRVLWNADDRVSIFNKTTFNREFRFEGEDGDNAGSFSRIPSDDFVTSNPLDYNYAIYPFDENNSISNDGELTISLPEVQSYREGSFGQGANTMIAVSEDNELMFKNLCGYIMLRLYGDNVSVTSISLKGNGGEPLAGKATVSASVEDVPVLAFDDTAGDVITLAFDEPVTLGTTPETATVFWLVVPPTEFEAGITLQVETADGGLFEKRTNDGLSISRNTRARMAPLAVTPGSSSEGRYLTFTSTGETTLEMNIEFHYDPDYPEEELTPPVLFYSTDKTNWTRWDFDQEHTLTFSQGHPLFLCGENPNGFGTKTRTGFGVNNWHFWSFHAQGSDFRVAGDIMSLIDKDEELTVIPTASCFYGLFQNCDGLLSGPRLPATTLADMCYYAMFRRCSSLTVAPELPATTLASECYSYMFYGCTGLTVAPELPATTLAYSCYHSMFNGCTSLTTEPELPATTLASDCYSYMFNRCTSLTEAPDLPAKVLASYGYYYMFSGCTSLTTAPELPAKALAFNCYTSMFSGCTSLTEAPKLPAMELEHSCYAAMFQGCTSLTVTPELPAQILEESCYSRMFSGCTQLNHVKCFATDISAQNCTGDWLSGVASSGSFVRAAGMNDWTSGESGIPAGWEVSEGQGASTTAADKYLTFTSEGTTTVSLIGNKAPVLYFSTDTIHWTRWDYSPLTFTNLQPLYLCGDNPEGFSSSENAYSRFTASGSQFHVSGDLMSLLDKDADVSSIPSDYCFFKLFYKCTALLSAPDLPATELTLSCYSSMFYGCSSLTAAPELAATTLASGCYYSMFNGCTSLTTAPELPATTLASDCYNGMFSGCTSLTVAPELPAKELEPYCYYSMFYGCSSLTAAPELPAKELEPYCYSSMFYGCSSLTVAPELPATTLASYCYNRMFYGCTSLIVAPELPAKELEPYCYYSMFYGCSSLTTAPELPAKTLVDNCYREMFWNCSQLNHVKCLATDGIDRNCIRWLNGVASSGTFVKKYNANWERGGIPEGWTVTDFVIPINTAADFMEWASRGDSDAQLLADITLPSSYIPKDLKADFFGNHHTITYHIVASDSQTTWRPGLFNSVDGYVEGLKVAGSIRTSVSPAGGIAASAADGAHFVGCENHVTISGDVSNLLYRIGGIVGEGGKETYFNNCKNTAKLEVLNSRRAVNIGGIVGYINHSVTMLFGSNNGELVFTGSGTPRIGGTVGYLKDVNAVTFHYCSNSGRISINSSPGNSSYTYAGGISGYYGTPASGANVKYDFCSNEGVISHTGGKARLGGILAHCGGTAVEENNPIGLTVSSCNNSGGISSSTSEESIIQIGGIIGITQDNSCLITCSGCTYTGSISSSANATVGGILGYMCNPASTFTKCTVGKNVRLQTAAGGKAGLLIGAGSSNAPLNTALTGVIKGGSIDKGGVTTSITAQNYRDFLVGAYFSGTTDGVTFQP